MKTVCIFLFGLVLSVSGDAPLLGGPYAPHVPAPVYGLPAPIPAPLPAPIPLPPAPVYGVPTRVHYVKPIIPISTTYAYNLPHFVPRVFHPYLAPLPLAPAPIYGAPRIHFAAPRPLLTSYNYPLPLIKPVEVYGPPKEVIGPYAPAAPHPTYGLPHF